MPTTRRTYTKTYHRTTAYHRPAGTYQRGWHPTTTYSCTAPAFKQPRFECQWRMGSYRTVFTQFTGAGKQTVFSPTTANKWIRYVNQGYRIYQFTTQQFSRYFGTQWTQGSPTACFRWMRQKYGTGIKAITRGNGRTWLVAATASVTGRPFQNYIWK